MNGSAYVESARQRRSPANLTTHGLARSHQRAIPHAIIDALIDFGERRPAGGGAEHCYFTKRTWRQFSSYLGAEARHFERYRSAYLVLAGDGAVITTGWRH